MRRKAIFISVIDVKIVLEYQPQEAGILRRESRLQRQAQTGNIYNPGSCQLIKFNVSNPLL